jgi:hypothetical protein
MAETGRYLYAIARGIDRSALGGTQGIDGAPLDVVEHRGLSAVVSDVSLDEFGEGGLRRNLEDLAWLEKVARGHDDVVQTVAPLGPTAPIRLATICFGDEGVRSRLDEWYDALQRALDRVERRMEWSVKAYAPRTEPQAASSSGERPSGADAGAGAAYLQRKRTETQDRQQAEERALRTAEAIHAALGEHAVAVRRLQPQDPRLTGHEGTMTLNGAYLVPVEEGDAFRSRVSALADEHPDARLEVQGPWPPYSFATLEDA